METIGMEMEFDKTIMDILKDRLVSFTLSHEVDVTCGKEEPVTKLITSKGVLRFKSIDAMVKALDLLVL